MKLPDSFVPFLYAVLRAATAGLSPIPGALVLDPLPVLLARQSALSDRSGWHGLFFLPGLILGDVLAGYSLWTISLRSLVVIVFLAAPQPGGFHHTACRWTFYLSLATAIAVDMSGRYPLGFITLAGVMQGFLWWGLLAPRTGGGTLRPYWPLLFPPAALTAVHLILPSPALWPLPVLSDHSSDWVRFFAILLLLEPAVWRAEILRRLWARVEILRKQKTPVPETTMEP